MHSHFRLDAGATAGAILKLIAEIRAL